MLGLTGFLGLTRIPLCFWTHTDLTDPTVLLCGWEISQMVLCVCGLVWAPMGAHCSRSHGFIFLTLRTNQTYRTYRTNWTFLKIIREICGICVRPPWTPCGRVTKLQKIVLFGGRFERFEKKCGKSCYIKKFLQTLCVKYKKWVGQTSLLLLF